MSQFLKPCLDCGVLSYGRRCSLHTQQLTQLIDLKRKHKRKHYTGDYQKRAKIVRENATHCWICNKGAIEGDPFQADHYHAGQGDSVLLPAHRSCNIRRGTGGTGGNR